MKVHYWHPKEYVNRADCGWKNPIIAAMTIVRSRVTCLRCRRARRKR